MRAYRDYSATAELLVLNFCQTFKNRNTS